MRRGRFSALRLSGGGARRSKSTKMRTGNGGSETETDGVPRATMGVQCPAAFEPRKWLAAGTVFLQQSSALAEGTHLPFRQQSIASRVRALAKQSNGWASNTIASRLTTI